MGSAMWTMFKTGFMAAARALTKGGTPQSLGRGMKTVVKVGKKAARAAAKR